jgi:hypothetical protein
MFWIFFIAKKPIEFWDPSKDPFLRGHFHPVVAETLAARQRTAAASARDSNLVAAPDPAEIYSNQTAQANGLLAALPPEKMAPSEAQFV